MFMLIGGSNPPAPQITNFKMKKHEEPRNIKKRKPIKQKHWAWVIAFYRKNGKLVNR